VTRQHPQQRLTPRGLWLGFKRLRKLGWSTGFPIVQFPNAPLIIAFLAGTRARARKLDRQPKLTRNDRHADQYRRRALRGA
jgi:hypothetical protein